MNNRANIIYFSSRSDALKIEKKLSSSGFETKMIPIKKCVIPDDIADYFIFDKNQLESLEKSYLRDGKTNPAILLSIQKIVLNRVLDSTQKNEIFFLEENFSPESFYLKKQFFKQNSTFFSFGKLSKESGLSVVKGALDIGFHEASLLYFGDSSFAFDSLKQPCFPDFNGLLAIDAPPDSIPSRYLHFFRQPQLMTRALIRFYDSLNQTDKHPGIYIFSDPKPLDKYSSSARTSQFIKFLGARGRTFSDFSELPAGTTVFTWSTKRFFTLLRNGFRPLPAARTLASLIFNRKSKSLENFILSSPNTENFTKIINFLNLCEIGKFKIK